jgi:hypothetical protein
MTPLISVHRMAPTTEVTFSDMATAIRRSNYKGSKSDGKLAKAGTLAPELMAAVQKVRSACSLRICMTRN